MRFVVLAVVATLSCPAIIPVSARAQAARVEEADRQRMEALGYEAWVKEGEVPGRTGVTLYDRRRTAPGYVLFPNRGSCNAQLIDNSGKVVHSWQGSLPGFWSDVELMPDGALYVVGATDDEFAHQLTARYLRKLSWDGKVLWQSSFPAHHDVERAPGGRLLTLSSVERETETFGRGRRLIDDHVVVLDAEGRTLEELSLHDLFLASPEGVRFGPYHRLEQRNGNIVLDAFHANSVQWIEPGKLAGKHPVYREGNFLVCIRHQNVVVVIDPRKRKIVWSWGQGTLEGPHSARMLASGNVLVFDNGLARRTSRILEVDPRTSRIVWSYEAPNPKEFFTPYGGSCQRLKNGNTLIAETRRGRLFEVDARGRIVWSFVNPFELPAAAEADGQPKERHRATIQSAKRLEPSYVSPILRRNRSPR